MQATGGHSSPELISVTHYLPSLLLRSTSLYPALIVSGASPSLPAAVLTNRRFNVHALRVSRKGKLSFEICVEPCCRRISSSRSMMSETVTTLDSVLPLECSHTSRSHSFDFHRPSGRARDIWTHNRLVVLPLYR
jgi:hypothetical protein